MTEDFSRHPRSVAEIKSDRSRQANHWTPRDVLISILRDIDADTIKPDALVVCWRTKPDDGVVHTSYSVSSPDIHVSLGLLSRAMHSMQETG